MKITSRLARAAGLAAALTASGCAVERTAERTPSGTYTVTYDNAGMIVGFHTGKGKLVLNDGTEYAFTADGYSLAALGYSVASASGNVYNLRIPADFAGEYGALGAAAVLVEGGGKAELGNRSSDVVIDVNSAETGLRLGAGGGFVTFRLGEKLKGPNVAVAPAPVPEKPASAAPAKPRSYEIEFGFNRAHVSQTNDPLFDTIVKDWGTTAVTFEVVGHADTKGTDPYNMKLSRQRAENVAAELRKRGIAAGRIAIRAVGEKGLAVTTPDDTRLRANRRVEILIGDAKN
jgi:outer membrane protein OmpA-like peptidoglycan-associated protein